MHRLIESSDGTLRRHVFYENVRDFQGVDNSVNSEIAGTLGDSQMLDKFVLLNNGVTVVARNFNNLRSREYEIGDYFVVNGCQTSHLIYQYRQEVRGNSSLKIPVKIIHTNSGDITARIIRSTNRQTPVPDEAFVSLERFHKRLQEFYKVYPPDASERLFYERRSREYSAVDVPVERPRIINLHMQIRAFSSVILGEPQLVMSNNPSTILREHRSRLFVDTHKFAPYFLSAYVLYKFNKLNQAGKIHNRYMRSKYWICWIARIVLSGRLDLGQLNSEKTEKGCESMVSQISDSGFALRLFEAAIEAFDTAASAYLRKNPKTTAHELTRLRDFRESVRDFLGSQIRSNGVPLA